MLESDAENGLTYSSNNWASQVKVLWHLFNKEYMTYIIKPGKGKFTNPAD